MGNDAVAKIESRGREADYKFPDTLMRPKVGGHNQHGYYEDTKRGSGQNN